MVDGIRGPNSWNLPVPNAAAQKEIAGLEHDLGDISKLKRTVNGTGSPQAAADVRRKEIDKATVQFEALLVKQMLGAMWQSVPQGGLLSGSNEEAIFRDMLNDTLAETVAKSQGIGIKEFVRKELQKNEKR